MILLLIVWNFYLPYSFADLVDFLRSFVTFEVAVALSVVEYFTFSVVVVPGGEVDPIEVWTVSNLGRRSLSRLASRIGEGVFRRKLLFLPSKMFMTKIVVKT